MNKVAIVAIVGVIAVVGALWYFGYLDDLLPSSLLPGGNNVPPPTDSDKLALGDSDIYYLLTIATGKTLNRATTFDYIDKLNMEIYGSNSHYTAIVTQYRSHYASWTNVLDSASGPGHVLAYTQGTDAASIFTATAPIIRTVYNYETLTLTSLGDVNDYNAFYNFILTS